MPTVFVVMPYQEPYEKIYETILEPVLRDRGFEVIRADQIPASSDIFNDMIQSIATADLVVIDATESNQNIYFEFGFAAANNKELLIIAEGSLAIPFDTRQWRHLLYDASNLPKLHDEFIVWLEHTHAFLRHLPRVNASRLTRGEVFPGLFDASISSDYHRIPVDDRILGELRAGTMLSCAHSYYTEKGTGHWLALCDDPLYTTFHASIRLLNENGKSILDALGDDFLRTSPDVVSLGPGNGQKDRILLRSIVRRLMVMGVPCDAYYYPIDISHRMLTSAIRTIDRDPELQLRLKIKAVLGDFSRLSAFRPLYEFRAAPNLFSFLGNTLGNMPQEVSLLQSIKNAMLSGDILLLELRLKSSSTQLDGHDTSQFGLSFAPLGRLGVPYDVRKIQIRREDTISQIPGTETLAVHYEKAIVGNEEFSDVVLSCVNYYDRIAVRTILEGKTLGFEILDTIENELLVLFILRKR